MTKLSSIKPTPEQLEEYKKSKKADQMVRRLKGESEPKNIIERVMDKHSRNIDRIIGTEKPYLDLIQKYDLDKTNGENNGN